MYSLSLAEIEVERRNNALSLTIDLDFNMAVAPLPASSNSIISTDVTTGKCGDRIIDTNETHRTLPTSVDSLATGLKDEEERRDDREREREMTAGVDSDSTSCGNSAQLEIGRDCTLLYVKVQALWTLKRFKSLLDVRDEKIALTASADVSLSTDTTSCSDSSNGNGTGNELKSSDIDRRRKEADKIFGLIETTRLRLGDCRGKYEAK